MGNHWKISMFAPYWSGLALVLAMASPVQAGTFYSGYDANPAGSCTNANVNSGGCAVLTNTPNADTAQGSYLTATNGTQSSVQSFETIAAGANVNGLSYNLYTFRL